MARDPNNLVILAGIVSVRLLDAAGKTFTAAADTDTFVCAAHGHADGDSVFLTSSGTLPAGLAVDTEYFVRDAAAGTLKLALTADGVAIDVTDVGTGTHTLRPGFVDIGEAPKVSYAPKIETKEHKSARDAQRSVDKVVVMEAGAEVTVEMEELTDFNLSLATGGDIAGGYINLLTKPTRDIALRVTGTNDGRRADLEVPSLTVMPDTAVELIGSDWWKGGFKGKTKKVEGHAYPFGRIKLSA